MVLSALLNIITRSISTQVRMTNGPDGSEKLPIISAVESGRFITRLLPSSLYLSGHRNTQRWSAKTPTTPGHNGQFSCPQVGIVTEVSRAMVFKARRARTGDEAPGHSVNTTDSVNNRCNRVSTVLPCKACGVIIQISGKAFRLHRQGTFNKLLASPSYTRKYPTRAYHHR